MAEPVLAAHSVSFAYREAQVLADVGFAAEPGEILGITGVNGAGKTTLIKLLCGLLKPGSGEVRVTGMPLVQLTPRQIAQRIALVPQEVPPATAFNVRDIVAMGRNPHLGRFAVEKTQDKTAIEQALASTGLLHLVRRPFGELSGGEQKRVFIARALAQQSEIVVLDEPTANLDLARQLELMRLLRGLAQEGRAIVLSMHDLSLASSYCDRILILGNKRVGAIGKPADVITPENLQSFFGLQAVVVNHERGMSVIPIALRKPFDKLNNMA